MSELASFLDKTARRAGELATRYLASPAELEVAIKGPQDFVTAADKAIEHAIGAMVKAAYPDDAILGEEGGRQKGRNGRLWIIDPIDGTTNYMRGLPWWSISIGLVDSGQPKAGIIHAASMNVTIAAVIGEGVTLNGEAFTREDLDRYTQVPLVMTGSAPNLVASGQADQLSLLVRSQLNGIERRLGCGTASLLQVLLSKADLYLGLGERIWDICAAAVIAEELGLRHSLTWGGAHDATPMNFACGKAALIEEVLPSLHLDETIAKSIERPWQGLFSHRYNG